MALELNASCLMECDQCLLDWRWCAWLWWSCACLAWHLPTGFAVALSWFHLFCSARNTSITKSQSVWTGIPSMRKLASREKISASVELCETEVCLGHLPTYWYECMTSKICTMSFWSLFWAFKFSCKIRVLKQSKSAMSCCVSSWQFVWIHMCDECKRSNAPSVCHKIVSILLWHAQACLQTTRYQVSQYEPNTDISKQFVSKLANCPTDSCSSSSSWWSPMHGVATLKIVESYYLPLRNFSAHFSAWPSMSEDQEYSFPEALVDSFFFGRILNANVSL